MTTEFDYLRDPSTIYEHSFSLVEEATDLCGIPLALHAVVLRLVHACAMPDIVSDLAWSDGVVEEARRALAQGRCVFTDCEMLAHGIISSRLPQANQVICTLNDVAVPARAKRLGTTRSAAAVDFWKPQLDHAVVAIGNAPTALFRLLEMIHEGARPAAIFAFPVGFVGASEAKRALTQCHGDIPYLTLHGRRGGSALAAAAINALLGNVQ